MHLMTEELMWLLHEERVNSGVHGWLMNQREKPSEEKGWLRCPWRLVRLRLRPADPQ